MVLLPLSSCLIQITPSLHPPRRRHSILGLLGVRSEQHISHDWGPHKAMDEAGAGLGGALRPGLALTMHVGLGQAPGLQGPVFPSVWNEALCWGDVYELSTWISFHTNKHVSEASEHKALCEFWIRSRKT